MLLSSAIRDFLLSRQAANRSERTIRWYADQLSVYQAHVGDIPVGQKRITPRTITAYMAAQRGTGISPGTLHARYRALRAFLNWCVSDPDCDLSHNPIDHVPPPKRPPHIPRYVTLTDYRSIVNAIPGVNWLDARDELIAHLLFWSGFRASELIGLAYTDLHLDRRIAVIRHGKGDKARNVPLSPQIPSALASYIYSRPPWDGVRLLASSDGYGGVRGALTVAGLQQMLRRRCAAAGRDAFLPHSWRHGFAMNMLEHGADLDWVGDVLGHEDRRVTRLYARWLDSGMTARFEQVYRRATRNT
jgi:site-specific recombinase XerC